MTNQEYQRIVEDKLGKPLKEIMHELCIAKELCANEGANFLGVPKETFKFWRNKFRFGPKQVQYDLAQEQNKKKTQLLKKNRAYILRLYLTKRAGSLGI